MSKDYETPERTRERLRQEELKIIRLVI
ncbi:DUF6366 family protein [Paenibacillus lautus]|nr:DUF6366 family protein [Paenibacillus lautus]